MSPGALLIRPATPDDAALVHALVERCYRGEVAKRGWTHEADLLIGQRTTREEIETNIAGEGHCMLVGSFDDRLVACLQLVREDDGAAYLGMFSVEPDLQGGGLGRRMLAAAEAEARERFGSARMHMWVIRQREELIAWYLRQGYALTGRTEPFPYDDPLDRPLRDDLEFLVLEKPINPAAAAPR